MGGGRGRKQPPPLDLIGPFTLILATRAGIARLEEGGEHWPYELESILLKRGYVGDHVGEFFRVSKGILGV